MILFIAIGLAAGVLAGLFGIGGGIVIGPALILLAKFQPQTATGTSLGAFLQERVFALMGITKTEAATRFGALLDALEYGAPPEGGIATGMDRTVMILAGLANARETIAFPKTQTGYDPLLDAPAELNDELLEELGLRVIKKPEKS